MKDLIHHFTGLLSPLSAVWKKPDFNKLNSLLIIKPTLKENLCKELITLHTTPLTLKFYIAIPKAGALPPSMLCRPLLHSMFMGSVSGTWLTMPSAER